MAFGSSYRFIVISLFLAYNNFKGLSNRIRFIPQIRCQLRPHCLDLQTRCPQEDFAVAPRPRPAGSEAGRGVYVLNEVYHKKRIRAPKKSAGFLPRSIIPWLPSCPISVGVSLAMNYTVSPSASSGGSLASRRSPAVERSARR
jgi:hypothetical protein